MEWRWHGATAGRGRRECGVTIAVRNFQCRTLSCMNKDSITPAKHAKQQWMMLQGGARRTKKYILQPQIDIHQSWRTPSRAAPHMLSNCIQQPSYRNTRPLYSSIQQPSHVSIPPFTSSIRQPSHVSIPPLTHHQSQACLQPRLVMGIGDRFIIDYWGHFNEQ